MKNSQHDLNLISIRRIGEGNNNAIIALRGILDHIKQENER